MEHLKSNMLTEMDGNPPIYITKRRTQQGEEIYVNNAMIIKSRSNVDLKNENGKRQVGSDYKHWLMEDGTFSGKFGEASDVGYWVCH